MQLETRRYMYSIFSLRSVGSARRGLCTIGRVDWYTVKNNIFLRYLLSKREVGGLHFLTLVFNKQRSKFTLSSF